MSDDPNADEVGPNAQAALAAMSDDDLALVELEAVGTDLMLTNWALLEMLKGWPWTVGVVGACAMSVGGLWGWLIPPITRLIIAGALLVGAGLGVAGQIWHHRRAGRFLATAKKRQAWRTSILKERIRRGSGS